MAKPVEARMEKIRSIKERAKLALTNRDYAQITQLRRELDNAMGR